jgi:hypothetical protein
MHLVHFSDFPVHHLGLLSSSSYLQALKSFCDLCKEERSLVNKGFAPGILDCRVIAALPFVGMYAKYTKKTKSIR